MTNYAALVAALYDKLGTWQAVADACNNGTAHSAGYYQQIAVGRIRKPAAAQSIISVVFAETPLKSPRTRAILGVLTFCRSTWLELRKLKNRLGWTWDRLMLEALDLLLNSYPEV